MSNVPSNILLILGSAAFPFVSLICGIILWKATPPVNKLFGFRSRRTLLSALAWNFAQQTAGRLLVKVYAPLIPLSVVISVFSGRKLDSDGKFLTFMCVLAIQIIVMIHINLRVNNRVNETFDEKGELMNPSKL